MPWKAIDFNAAASASGRSGSSVAATLGVVVSTTRSKGPAASPPARSTRRSASIRSTATPVRSSTPSSRSASAAPPITAAYPPAGCPNISSFRPLRRAAYSRWIVAQMNAAELSRHAPPSFACSSGRQSRSKSVRPPSFTSQSSTGTPSSRSPSVTRLA